MRVIFILILSALLGCGGEKQKPKEIYLGIILTGGKIFIDLPRQHVIECSNAETILRAICSNGGYNYSRQVRDE